MDNSCACLSEAAARQRAGRYLKCVQYEGTRGAAHQVSRSLSYVRGTNEASADLQPMLVSDPPSGMVSKRRAVRLGIMVGSRFFGHPDHRLDEQRAMRIPIIRGIIDRRILANYRIDPDVLQRVLPPPFRPKLIKGYGVGGICLIRLKQLRPRWLPIPLGLGSENAAHRIAVEWDGAEGPAEGVYIPRRDTDSRLNVLAGGRVFPGVHHRARFHVAESGDRLSVALTSVDGDTRVAVSGTAAEELSGDSVFDSLGEASAFFESGSLGYSATRTDGRYDGLELQCDAWHVAPMAVEHVHSSFFQDHDRFPAGSARFDCALLMRGIAHEGHGRTELCCPTNA